MENYCLDLKLLTKEASKTEYHLGDDFFASFTPSEINGGDVKVEVEAMRADNAKFTIKLSLEGSVKVPCNRCLENMDIPVDLNKVLTVKNGDDFEETEDIITVNSAKGILDLSERIYETIALSIPMTHVHPEGLCDKEMMNKLQELSADINEQEN